MDYDKTRYLNLLAFFQDHFNFNDRAEIFTFSSPGRIELCGNHTDHNQGLVIAAAIDLDILAVVQKRSDNLVFLKSIDEPNSENLNFNADLEKPSLNPSLYGTSKGIVLGIANYYIEAGFQIGGFDIALTSNVPVGCGTSSSAAFEILIASILNIFYNHGRLRAEFMAKSGKYAENIYFGKASGLMDQLAIAKGGITFLNFHHDETPVSTEITLDFNDLNLALCLVDTGGNHAELTGAYDSIPLEMKAIATFFRKKYLRELTKSEILENIQALRPICGDRAILRALHFFDENTRVEKLHKALIKKDKNKILEIIRGSGKSSFQNLQNIYTIEQPKLQGLSLALYIAEDFLGKDGAYRVHGGGFAGSTLNLVPKKNLAQFIKIMESAFSHGCCHIVSICNANEK